MDKGLNEKLAKWAGWEQLNVHRWKTPALKETLCCPDYCRSLDAQEKDLWPKLKRTSCHLVGDTINNAMVDKREPALACANVIEEYIDNERKK